MTKIIIAAVLVIILLTILETDERDCQGDYNKGHHDGYQDCLHDWIDPLPEEWFYLIA